MKAEHEEELLAVMREAIATPAYIHKVRDLFEEGGGKIFFVGTRGMGVIEGLFEILTNRGMGTIHEGMGGEYPQYNGPHGYSREIRQEAINLLIQVLGSFFRKLPRGLSSMVNEEDWPIAGQRRLAGVLAQASKDLEI